MRSCSGIRRVPGVCCHRSRTEVPGTRALGPCRFISRAADRELEHALEQELEQRRGVGCPLVPPAHSEAGLKTSNSSPERGQIVVREPFRAHLDVRPGSRGLRRSCPPPPLHRTEPEPRKRPRRRSGWARVQVDTSARSIDVEDRFVPRLRLCQFRWCCRWRDRMGRWANRETF